ncbi:hypothetical protein Pcinc_033609 [Petrolisthes cinctipes]|uniref:C2H2-type domain-containing protein n=1 Tax=Petrolisthes cinctipes TaxID=88211 RepID=A0AAE1ES16_PETCI|nr:hypothetical protein Pcinc_033609 [Petrolisthes cinctipes]
MSHLHIKSEVSDGGGGVSDDGQISVPTTGTELPIVMNEDIYPGTDEQQCFVLVDDRTVGVMPGDSTSAMQRLLTSQTPTTTSTISLGTENTKGVKIVEVKGKDAMVGVMPSDSTSAMQRLLTSQTPTTTTTISLGTDNTKGMEMVQVEGKDAVEMMHVQAGRTVLHMDDGKTLELVQMDGGKTLEVMNIDASSHHHHHHADVLQVEGGSNIEVICDARLDKISIPSTSLSSTVLDKRKVKRLLHKGTKHAIQTPQGGNNTPGINLRSIATVTPSIVLSSGKRVNLNHVLPSRTAFLTSGNKTHGISTSTGIPTLSHIKSHNINTSTGHPALTRNKSHNISTSTGLPALARIKSNIIFSDTKQVLSTTTTTTDSGMNDAIIISWPTLEPDAENTVATQTDICDFQGPSMNLFFCTFYPDGSVQTQCDMPVLRHKEVSTQGRGRCRGKSYNWDRGNQSREREPPMVKMLEEDQRYSRRGRVLKGKGSLYKLSGSDMEEEQDDTTDFTFVEVDEEAKGSTEDDHHHHHHHHHQGPMTRKKRGRKRKKRPPSPDNFDEELQLVIGDRSAENESELDTPIKPKPEDIEDEEQATEVLRVKGYGLRTKRRLKKLSDMHYIQEKTVKKRVDRSQEFTCQVCDRVFPTFFRLQRHAKDEHDSTEFSFPCDVCGVVFTRPHNLERHKDTKHGTGERRYACEHCGRRFTRQDVLSVHISMVHLKGSVQGGKKGPAALLGSNAFHCTSCDKFFSREQRLKEHREGDLTCADCSLSFECKTSLRIHQYKHHPRACNECGKVCNNKQLMYLHRLSHKPKFVCNICNKGFLWKSQYTIHMATHTGEKPVLCDICGRSFAHKVAVSKHKWQEHNENNKKFKCEQCGKSFVYRGKLQSHMRSHTGEKPFTCHLCTNTFSQRCNLTAHIKSVHGVYIHSIKSDGTAHMELVKYRRPKKPPSTTTTQLTETTTTTPQATIVNTVIGQPSQASSEDHQTPVATIQEQVQISESSFETEAAVYQIVMYPQ